MTSEQRESALAEFERMHASLPEAKLADSPALFNPGIVVFLDGRFQGFISDVAQFWPDLSHWVAALLELMPMRHDLEKWRERIERGATLTAWFINSDGATDGVGIVNCELMDEGKPVVFAGVQTYWPIDLTDLATGCEFIATVTDAAGVTLWTPGPVPLVQGYQLEGCWFGQMQFAPVKPVQ